MEWYDWQGHGEDVGQVAIICAGNDVYSRQLCDEGLMKMSKWNYTLFNALLNIRPGQGGFSFGGDPHGVTPPPILIQQINKICNVNCEHIKPLYNKVVNLKNNFDRSLIILNSIKWFYLILNSNYNNKFSKLQISKSIKYFKERIAIY